MTDTQKPQLFGGTAHKLSGFPGVRVLGESQKMRAEQVMGSGAAGHTVVVSIADEALLPILAELRELRAEVAHLREMRRVERKQYFLVASGDPGIRFKVPIPVSVESAPGCVVVHAPDLEVFGSSADEISALQDFRRSLSEEFRELADLEAKLGPGPRGQLRRMREVLEVVA